ncbi:NMT1/THI5 like protein [Mycolicibacterium conceptionense]|uniref:Thiamine pyrimidine synthase n=1 Tax=Mycolicibacterium conceptionense TaxID=451644 RepID=A0A0U1CYB6_9MYCO|nr:ABC transporter substrate-binding protein [Mycolicibacterium conceptionense]ORV27646.1 hypothetical protein AWB98_12360 [Mycolicibacterium conceptionense]CQD02451.1 NMT1/THI5 like protein [Mycolicibacterium conceptionense]
MFLRSLGRKTITVACAALLLGTGVVACADSKGGAAASGPDNETVLLSYMHDIQNAHYYWVQDKGLDQQCGFHLELRTAGDVSNPLQVLVGGGADIALVEPLAYITAVQQGLPVIAIGEDVAKSPMTYTSLPESNIHGPADLVGKTVGIETGADDALWFLKDILHKTLPADQVDQVKVVRIGASTAPLFAKSVDAIGVWTTATDIVSRQAKGEQFNMIKVSDYGIDMPGNVIVVTKDKLAKQPDRVSALLATVLTAMSATLKPENSQQSVYATQQRIDAPVSDEIQADLYKKMWDIRTTDYWTEHGVGANDPAGYATAMKFLVDNGQIPAPVAADQLFSNQAFDAVTADGKVRDLGSVPGCKPAENGETK